MPLPLKVSSTLQAPDALTSSATQIGATSKRRLLLKPASTLPCSSPTKQVCTTLAVCWNLHVQAAPCSPVKSGTVTNAQLAVSLQACIQANKTTVLLKVFSCELKWHCRLHISPHCLHCFAGSAEQATSYKDAVTSNSKPTPHLETPDSTPECDLPWDHHLTTDHFDQAQQWSSTGKILPAVCSCSVGCTVVCEPCFAGTC